MQWIPCSGVKWIPIECSGFHAAWPNGSRLNAVDSVQCGGVDSDWLQWIPCSVAQWISIECTGFHAACLNAVYSMQREEMEPNWMQGFYAALLNAVDSKSKIECSGFYAAWPKASRLNAVDSMHCDWMQWTACNVVKCIPIECSGFHPAWLSAVDSIQLSKMNPD